MLIFVYNADSGAVNTLLDSAHKILSPSTYQCQLCQLTYGVFKENEAWKDFRQALSEEVVFLHRDEFEQQYPDRFSYPVLLRVGEGKLKELLPAETINTATDTMDLIEQCNKAIK